MVRFDLDARRMSTLTEYPLGMSPDPDEVLRLEQQHLAWQRQTERLWDLAGICAGQTVIDLGCGPGFTAVDLARRVGPSGRVVAIDASTATAEHARAYAARQGLSNVEIVSQLEAEADLSRWSPDVVFARWFYWFVPDAEESIARVASALGEGGTVAVLDYCNYHGIGIEPASPLFDKVFRAVADSVADQGGSLDIAGRMPALFRASGLTVSAIEPLNQVASPGSPVWRWVSTFQRLYLPALVERGYLARQDLDDHVVWWAAREQDPATVFFAPPILGVVGRKGTQRSATRCST